LLGTKQSPTIQSGDAWRFTYHVKPLIAAEATTFVLIQKVAKNQVIRNASLPHKAIAGKSGKTWAAAFLPCYRSLVPRLSKKPLCPAIIHKATIVLPDFI
jgi:hypothetical protein